MYPAIEQDRRPVVLVVDDDPDLRMLARMQLSDAFEVIHAPDGEECLKLASERGPDVILLDMMMPVMDGADVMIALSKQTETRDIPVILLSALDATEDKVRGLQGGAVDYVAKPFEPQELKARIGSAARLRARRAVPSGAGDEVTGLRDRSEFEQRLREEIARTRRNGAPFSIALFDVDQMDRINEVHGRAGGDAVLARIAARLRGALRVSDSLFRYGGDEFAAVLAQTNVATAYVACERLRAAVTATGDAPAVTISVGIAEYAVGRSSEELVAKAEIALFRAKESGGDRSWRSDDPRRRALSPASLSEELTQREWDILGQLVRRRTETEIARHLGISTGTVRSHKARIRRKLHVAPETRLGDFVRGHLQELGDRLGATLAAAPGSGDVGAERR